MCAAAADRPVPRFLPEDLADVLVPASPVVWGDRVVYALRRVELAERKTRCSLHVVPIAGGAASRALTRGPWSDHAPAADPRGRFVVFVSDRGAGDQVYRIDADGGDARALTALPRGTIAALEVSPDGSRVALVLTPAPPKDDALPLAADLARTRGALLSDEIPNTVAGASATTIDHPPAPSDSPRARVTGRLRNRTDGVGWLGAAHAHLWIVDATTGAAERVARGDRDYGAPCWLPDGTAVIATATRSPPRAADLDETRNDLVLVRIADQSIETLRKPDGAVVAPSVSPRGDAVAYVLLQAGDDFGWSQPHAWLTPIGGAEAGAPRALSTELDRPLFDYVLDDLVDGFGALNRPMWSADGARVTFVGSDHGAVRLWDQPIDGTRGSWRTSTELAVGSASGAGDGRVVAVVGARGRFAELGVVSLDGAVRTLTDHNAALSSRVAPRAPEIVRIERDGVTLEGYYLSPRGVAAGTRAPAVLYVHGGPHTCYGERLFFEMQWLADEGYAVMYPNPRGSQSFGEAYAKAISFHWGDPDVGDQLAFVDWLASRPEVDPDRIGIAGGSYGGFMALLMAASTDRFRTAIAERGLYNWASSVGASDYGHTSPEHFGGKLPWEDPAVFLAHSPIRLVHQVRAPMLVIHYEGDLRVGPQQAIELFDALALREVPTALVLFPDEFHGMSRGGRIDRRLERLRQIRAWLDQWLRG